MHLVTPRIRHLSRGLKTSRPKTMTFVKVMPPQTDKMLVAADSLLDPPIVLVLDALADRAQLIANMTGASTMLLDFKSTAECIGELSNFTNCKRACVSFGRADDALAIAVEMHKRNMDLACVAAFGGIEKPFQDGIGTVPLYSPAQIHVAASDVALQNTLGLAQQWQRAIKKQGGPHAKGLHSMEAFVYSYENCKPGFVDSPSKETDLAMHRLFSFLVDHLKSK